MWKNLISTGQQATRTTRRIHPSRGLWVPTTSTMPQRPFSAAPSLQKQSEDFDREALKPEPAEATKSATDQQISQHESAYDPHNTAPESEMEATEKESQQKGGTGSLNVSGANQEVNKWRGPQEGGPDRNAEREASSSRGTPNKRRTIHVKEDGTHVSYR